jgi:hypothetical protein
VFGPIRNLQGSIQKEIPFLIILSNQFQYSIYDKLLIIPQVMLNLLSIEKW